MAYGIEPCLGHKAYGQLTHSTNRSQYISLQAKFERLFFLFVLIEDPDILGKELAITTGLCSRRRSQAPDSHYLVRFGDV